MAISKAHLDAHRLADGHSAQFDNDPAGFRALIGIGTPVECVAYRPLPPGSERWTGRSPSRGASPSDPPSRRQGPAAASHRHPGADWPRRTRGAAPDPDQHVRRAHGRERGAGPQVKRGHHRRRSRQLPQRQIGYRSARGWRRAFTRGADSSTSVPSRMVGSMVARIRIRLAGPWFEVGRPALAVHGMTAVKSDVDDLVDSKIAHRPLHGTVLRSASRRRKSCSS